MIFCIRLTSWIRIHSWAYPRIGWILLTDPQTLPFPEWLNTNGVHWVRIIAFNWLWAIAAFLKETLHGKDKHLAIVFLFLLLIRYMFSYAHFASEAKRSDHFLTIQGVFNFEFSCYVHRTDVNLWVTSAAREWMCRVSGATKEINALHVYLINQQQKIKQTKSKIVTKYERVKNVQTLTRNERMAEGGGSGRKINEIDKLNWFFLYQTEFTSWLRMYHVCDRPMIANCVVEYSDSCSSVIYIHLAQLFWELASHIRWSMSQLFGGQFFIYKNN